MSNTIQERARAEQYAFLRVSGAARRDLDLFGALFVSCLK
jgi:hypothetical protein